MWAVLNQLLEPLRVGVFGAALLMGIMAGPMLAFRRRLGLRGNQFLATWLLSGWIIVTAALVLLPLPEPGYVCTTDLPQPLFTLRHASAETAAETSLFRNKALAELLFNIALFMPPAIVLRRGFGWSVLGTMAAGLGCSAVIEVAQGTALFGAFPCPWRTMATDDLITNTLGALLGALLSPRSR